MPYAINLIDAPRDDKDVIMLQCLIGDILSQEYIQIDKDRVDEIGWPLLCDDARGEAILQVIRKKFPKHQLRMYYSKTGKGGWKRV